MTQDCSGSPSAADESKRFPKGIRITKADNALSDLGIEGVSLKESNLPWGYLFIHNKKVPGFERDMQIYNMEHPDEPHACFVHRSFVYKQKSEAGGGKKNRTPHH